MRRAGVLAVTLLLVSATGVQAAGVAKVTGTYQTEFGGVVATITVDAHATTPASGTFSFSNTVGGFIDGEVTCVTIEGSDAWIAGPVLDSDIPGLTSWAARLHDGGTPGTNGDLAITFVDFESLDWYCERARTNYDRYMVPVAGGNLVIH